MQSVRGTHDLVFSSARRFRHVVDSYTAIARRFGFQEIKTPIFEFSQVFSRTLGDASDIVSKEMYSFTDKGGDSLSLRPEGTAGIVRAYIEQGMQHQWPLKFHYEGPMFRYERPQKGRYRQFYQIGAELLGVENSAGDIETISLAQLLLDDLGVAQKCYLEINSIGDKESRDVYRTKLVEYYKKHENELSEDSRKRLTVNPLRILDSKDKSDAKINEGAPRLLDSLNALSAEKFAEVQKGLSDLKIPFKINQQLVRGLDYYCHLVFEFRTQELGSQDAVLSGGRYDGLSEAMGGPKTAAVGWAAGVERLSLLLPEEPKGDITFSLIPIGDTAEAYCRKLAQDLRRDGLAIDMAYSGNLSNRMKKAAARLARAVVIIGDNEITAGEFGLKILASGEQIKVKEADLKSKLLELSS
jgi:histidyl-tRNA synthetase